MANSMIIWLGDEGSPLGNSAFTAELSENSETIWVPSFEAAQKMAAWPYSKLFRIIVELTEKTFFIPDDYQGEFGFDGEDGQFAAEKKGMTIFVPALICKQQLAFQNKFEVVVVEE